MPLALTALISAGIVLLDRLSKFFLMDADSVLIPGLIRLTGTRNTGAAFSLFSDSALTFTDKKEQSLAIIIVARLFRSQSRKTSVVL